MAAPFPTRFLVDQITGSMVLATGVALTTAFYAYTRRVRAPYQKWFSAMQSIVRKTYHSLSFAFFSRALGTSCTMQDVRRDGALELRHLRRHWKFEVNLNAADANEAEMPGLCRQGKEAMSNVRRKRVR